MCYAVIGYLVLVATAFLCAYWSTNRAIDPITQGSDTGEYFLTFFRIEGFNRALLLNLSLGGAGVCFTFMPNDALSAR